MIENIKLLQCDNSGTLRREALEISSKKDLVAQECRMSCRRGPMPCDFEGRRRPICLDSFTNVQRRVDPALVCLALSS